MTFIPTDQELGVTPIANTDTTLRHPIGKIIKAYDATYGEGEFIYLYGVASNTVGSLVTYNAKTGVTTLSPNTANLAQPVAVSMAANTTTTSGSWYQIGGAAVVKKTATKVNPNVAVFQSATTGRIMATVATGKELLGARSANTTTIASATSTVVVTISRPFMQGQII